MSLKEEATAELLAALQNYDPAAEERREKESAPMNALMIKLCEQEEWLKAKAVMNLIVLMELALSKEAMEAFKKCPRYLLQNIAYIPEEGHQPRRKRA